MKIEKQTLSPEKMLRANRTACSVMLASYVCFLLIESDALNKGGLTPAVIIRCLLYILVGIFNYVMVSTMGKTTRCMSLMCLSFTILYAIMGLSHDPINLMAVFPTLLGLTVFLNGRLLLMGSFWTTIVVIIKLAMVFRANDLEAVKDGFLVLICVLIAAYICNKAISLLIQFSKEDQEELNKKAEVQSNISNAVIEIVTEINETFEETLGSMERLNEAMDSTNQAVDNIAINSEQTAETAGKQVEMTAEIQSQLEETSKNAEDALQNTEALFSVINAGVASAEGLKTQSQMVNQNTNSISQIMEELVMKVEMVGGITDSILNISSQTNLLALNASIEAARAGEAGKGFAVVADEIRNLAEETRQSTEQITNIMNELTSVTRDTQREIQNSVESISKQNEMVHEVTEAFENAEQHIEKLNSGVTLMSESVAAVLQANTEIVESIQLLSGASQEVSAETESSRSQLEEVTDGLHKFSDSIIDTSERLQELQKVATS